MSPPVLAALCAAAFALVGPSDARADETAVATFRSDWTFSVEGELEQGGELEIVYDVERLPTCRDRRYGQPAWSILARYRFESGQEGTVPVTSGAGTLYLAGSGELELWFENQGYYGCRAYDSQFGQNYRLSVASDPGAPGWVGNDVYVIDRRTCAGGDRPWHGGPCDDSRRPLYQTFSYGSWERQRAVIASIYFDVWKEGVTDFDNTELWRDLDVQVHYRARPDGAFTSEYVNFFQRVGNDARYALDIARLDPFASFTGGGPISDPADCPDAEILTSGDGVTIGATVEYYFTINGVRLGPSIGPVNYTGRFDHARAPFEICIAQ